MKTRNLIILGILVLVWEAFLGHTRLFGAIELFPVVGALILFKPDVRKTIYVFVLGLLVSLVAVEMIGMMSLAFSFGVFVVLVVNRFSQILDQNMSYLAVIFYLAFYKATTLFLVALLNDNLDFVAYKFILFILSHLILVYILKYLFRFDDKDKGFTV